MARYYRVTVGTIGSELPLAELVNDGLSLTDLIEGTLSAFRNVGADSVGVSDSASASLSSGSLFGGNFGGNF